MRIGIHQPNFLPWMGYYYKMAQCDTFVFLDNVEYTKKSFTKRVKVHHPQDIDRFQYLTVHLQKHSDHAKINELIISQHHNWQKKIRNRLYETYHKAPFYHQVKPIIEVFFTEPLQDVSFSNFTISIIKYTAALLGIKTNFLISSDLNTQIFSNDINLNLIKTLNGSTYISGIGAKKYQNVNEYASNHIELTYSDYKAAFSKMEIPDHFVDKSIISYLANYDVKSIQAYLCQSLV